MLSQDADEYQKRPNDNEPKNSDTQVRDFIFFVLSFFSSVSFITIYVLTQKKKERKKNLQVNNKMTDILFLVDDPVFFCRENKLLDLPLIFTFIFIFLFLWFDIVLICRKMLGNYYTYYIYIYIFQKNITIYIYYSDIKPFHLYYNL